MVNTGSQLCYFRVNLLNKIIAENPDIVIDDFIIKGYPSEKSYNALKYLVNKKKDSKQYI